MNKAIIISWFFFLPFLLLGQEENAGFRNVLSLSVLGHTLSYSLNYEGMVVDKEKFKTSIQAGLSYMGDRSFFRRNSLLAPVTINEMFKVKRGEYVELGIGGMFLMTAADINRQIFDEWYLIGKVGYRFQLSTKRWLAKVYYTPVLFGDGVLHSGSFEIGYRF